MDLVEAGYGSDPGLQSGSGSDGDDGDHRRLTAHRGRGEATGASRADAGDAEASADSDSDSADADSDERAGTLLVDATSAGAGHDGLMCVICQSACVRPHALECGHVFCLSCINSSPRRMCALCRRTTTRTVELFPSAAEPLAFQGPMFGRGVEVYGALLRCAVEGRVETPCFRNLFTVFAVYMSMRAPTYVAMATASAFDDPVETLRSTSSAIAAWIPVDAWQSSRTTAAMQRVIGTYGQGMASWVATGCVETMLRAVHFSETERLAGTHVSSKGGCACETSGGAAPAVGPLPAAATSLFGPPLWPSASSLNPLFQPAPGGAAAATGGRRS